jgi:hypothetical protein
MNGEKTHTEGGGRGKTLEDAVGASGRDVVIAGGGREMGFD